MMSKQEQEIKLDKIDRKILYELDVDSRQTNSQISKKVGTSKEVVNYRINKLEEKGVIIRYSTIIDLFKIGYKKYKIYIKLRGASKEKKEEIGKYFFENKNTEWVIIGSGRWEVIANYFSRNEQEFDDEVQEFMNKYHEYIQEKATVTTLQISHATREYLGEKKSPKKEYIEYNIERSAESIDETDKQILHTIANNARMSIIEIAKLAKTTARIVQYRLKEMKRKKIILAYKVTINPAKIGKMLCKACFYLGAADRKRIKEFMKYLHNIEEGIWPQKILGPWDV